MTEFLYHRLTSSKWKETRYWLPLKWCSTGGMVGVAHLACALGMSYHDLHAICEKEDIMVTKSQYHVRYPGGLLDVDSVSTILEHLQWSPQEIERACGDFKRDSGSRINEGEKRPRGQFQEDVTSVGDDAELALRKRTRSAPQVPEYAVWIPATPPQGPFWAKLKAPWPNCTEFPLVDLRANLVDLKSIARALHLPVQFVETTYIGYRQRLGLPFDSNYIDLNHLRNVLALLKLDWTLQQIEEALLPFAPENLCKEKPTAIIDVSSIEEVVPSRKRPVLSMPALPKMDSDPPWVAQFAKEIANLCGPDAVRAFRFRARHAELVDEFVASIMKAKEADLREHVIKEIREKFRPAIEKRLREEMAHLDSRFEQAEAIRLLEEMKQKSL